MHEKEFNSLIKSDRFQVFLFTCPANVPFIFAAHPWLVTHRKGSLTGSEAGRDIGCTRSEVLFKTRQNHTSWGHLHQNLFPPAQGIAILPFSNAFFWKSRLCGYIEGDED